MVQFSKKKFKYENRVKGICKILRSVKQCFHIELLDYHNVSEAHQ